MDKKNGLEVPSGAFSFSDYLSNICKISRIGIWPPKGTSTVGVC